MELERKKKMNCMDALKKVLENDGMPDVEALEHANNCQHCKRLGEDWTELSSLTPDDDKKIPQDIEESILAAASEYADKRKCNHRSFVLLKWPLISSAAACLVISFAALLYMNVKDEAPAPKQNLQYMSLDEKWNNLDMTEELKELRDNIDSRMIELSMPKAVIDTSLIKTEKSVKNLS